MTYSTHAIDAISTGSATTAVSAPVRSARRRRHLNAMRHHTTGPRIVGFGI